MCSPTVIFDLSKEHQWSAFSFRAQITQILLFSGMSVSKRWKITVWKWHLSQNFFCYGSFMYLPALKVVFFLGLRCLGLFCFGECHMWRDQRSQFESNVFSKNLFGIEVLGICLPYVKTYFQEHQWSTFFFRTQITQILFFRESRFWRDKSSQLEHNRFFKSFFTVKFFFLDI